MTYEPETLPDPAAGAEDPLAQFESEVVVSARVDAQPSPSTSKPTPAAAPVVTKVAPPAPVPSPEVRTHAPAVSPPENRHRISLDDVIARLTQVEWIEAVAIVEAVCAALASGSNSGMGVSELPDILIASDGSVTIRNPTPGAHSAERLARILHALAGTANIPIALRLFITNWTGTESRSIQQFHTELTFFARPNGATLIRGVYERCLAARATESPRAMRRPAKPVLAANRLRDWRLRRGPVAVVGVLSLLAVGMWLLRAATAVPNQLLTEAEAAGGPVEVSGPATADAPDSASTRVPSVAGRPVARPSRLSAPRAVSTDATAGTEAGVRTARSAPLTPRRAGSPDPNDMTVYSDTDYEVAPPKIVYKRLTASPPEPRGYPSTIELVIAKDGTVEQVKLLSPSKLMQDVMVLHAAKAWQFAPASRDGYPVRYRLVLTWDGKP